MIKFFTAMLLVAGSVLSLPALAQKKEAKKRDVKLDSLQTVLGKATSDTAKISVQCAIVMHTKRQDAKKALEIAEKAHQQARKTKLDNYIALSLRAIAGCYEILGKSTETVHYYKEAIEIYDRIGNERERYETYNELGAAYFNQNLFEKALEYFVKSIQYAQKIEDKNMEARLLNNLGAVYARDNDHPKAEEVYKKAYEINKAGKKYAQMMSNLNNLGNIYRSMKKYEASLNAFEELLEIGGRIVKDSNRIYIAYGNLSFVYRELKQFDKALDYAEKSLAYRLKTTDQRSIASAYLEVSSAQLAKNEYAKAEVHALKSLEISKKTKTGRQMMSCYETLGQIYEGKQDFKQSSDFYKKYAKMNDSLNNADRLKQMAQMRTLYEMESKEAENLKLRQKNALNEAQKSRFYAIGIAISIALLGVVVVAFVLYRSNAHKNALNKILTMQKAELAEQTEEIQVQNEELRQQQEEITVQRDYISKQNSELTIRNDQIEAKNEIIESSIIVALQIQKAMLPYPARMQSTLDEHFVLNKPKDIVSGDYYWLQKIDDRIILAVIDCVGHGVPGALMSMIAHAFFDKVVVLQERLQPAEILEGLETEVKYALQTDVENTQGGMDVAIAVWQPSETDKIQLTYGGAKRPIFLKRPNSPTIEELGTTRRSVGGEINLALPFEQHTIAVEKGSIVYMFSDGITDQNDVKRNRLGAARLKEFLQENAHLDMEMQKTALNDMLAQYMKDTVQRDDILLLGVKL